LFSFVFHLLPLCGEIFKVVQYRVDDAAAAAVLREVSAIKASGRQFLVAFPQHEPPTSHGPAAARLYVTSSSRYPLRVVISLPGQDTAGLLWPPSEAPPFSTRQYRLLHSGDYVECQLPSAVQLHGTDIENKGSPYALEAMCTVYATLSCM